MGRYSSQRNSNQKRELKKKLFKKYGKRNHCNCFYCRIRLTFKEATIEHLIPLSMGGNWHINNLRIACQFCNNDRGTKDWREYKKKYDDLYENEGINTIYFDKIIERNNINASQSFDCL